MAKQWTRVQQDLFEEPPSVRLGAAERAKTVEQLQVLLMEAMATLTARLEVGDDQDHV